MYAHSSSPAALAHDATAEAPELQAPQPLGNAALNELLARGEVDAQWPGGLLDWIRAPEERDEGECEIPEDELDECPVELIPIVGPEMPEPAPVRTSRAVQEHFDEYLEAIGRAFRHPGLGALDCGPDEAAISARLVAGWVQIGDPEQDTRAGILAVEHALHDAAVASLVVVHPEVADAIRAGFGAARSRICESNVYSRITSPSSYGLAWPSAALLGVQGVDVAGQLAEGQDPTRAVGPDGEALDIPTVLPVGAPLADRASRLADMLGAATLTSEHLAAAHDDVAALYTGAHADLLAAHGLPDTSAEVFRQLQVLVPYANQRDNASVDEEPAGGTCNFTALAMAMQAAGLVPPNGYRGVALTGMQYEERLLAMVHQDFAGNITSADVWRHVVLACGGQFIDLQMSGQSTWAQWQAVQTEHLDQGHGVIVSNNGHVLRIQSVDEAGVTIDDPYSRGRVLETEGHPGKFRATLAHVPPEPEPGEAPIAISPPQLVEVDAFSQAGKYWETYDPQTESFSDELTEALRAQRCQEAAAATTDTVAAHWVITHGPEWRGHGDRTIGRKNAQERDRSAEGYEQGSDTVWGRDETVGHYMNGVWAVSR